MYNEFGGTLSNLALAKHRKSRAINAENPRGEKGTCGSHGAVWCRMAAEGYAQ